MKKVNGMELYLIYRHHSDIDTVIPQLDAFLHTAKRNKLSLLIISCSGDLFEEIGGWQPNGYELNIVSQTHRLSSVILTRAITRLGKTRHIRGNSLIFKSDVPDIYIVVTHEKREFIDRVLIPFFQSYSPTLYTSFFSSPQIKKILDDVLSEYKKQYSEKSGINVRIIANRLVAYERARHPTTEVVYTKKDYNGAFEDAMAQDLWVDKVDFSVEEYEQNIAGEFLFKKELLHGYISRGGLFTCKKNFSGFFKNVVMRGVEIAYNNKAMLSNRGRTEKNDFESRPVILEYDLPVFAEKSKNEDLIISLKGIPFSSLSIYHSNPYFHASFVDFMDGSSFDIWVLSENRIIIVPQSNTSFTSFGRLINHIFEEFQEGEIVETIEDMNLT